MTPSQQKIQIDMIKDSGLYFVNITRTNGSSYTKKICVF